MAGASPTAPVRTMRSFASVVALASRKRRSTSPLMFGVRFLCVPLGSAGLELRVRQPISRFRALPRLPKRGSELLGTLMNVDVQLVLEKRPSLGYGLERASVVAALVREI